MLGQKLQNSHHHSKAHISCRYKLGGNLFNFDITGVLFLQLQSVPSL